MQKFLGGFLKLVLVLYGSMIAPALPDFMLKWFDNYAFRLFIIALIVWTANHDPSLAILIAFGFYTSVNVLSGKQAFETFTELSNVPKTESQNQYYN